MNQIQVTSVSSKGQVVIPNNIRAGLGLSPGSKLLVFSDGDNLLLKPIQKPKFETFKALIKKSQRFASHGKLKQSDVQKIIKEVRHENRS